MAGTVRVVVLLLTCSVSISTASEIPSPTGASSIFSLFPIFPTFTDTKNERCRNDSQTFREQLKEFKLWAVTMLDASTKLPDGVLAGNTHQLGHFDECLSVKVGLQENRTLKGQYCLAQVQYFPSNLTIDSQPRHTISEEHFNKSAWHYIKSYSLDRSVRRRDEIFWSLCIPDSCNPQDVEGALLQALQSESTTLGMDFSVSVGRNMCQVKTNIFDFSWITPSHLIFGAVTFFFISMVAISTFLQSIGKLNKTSSSEIGKFLNCFSGQNNFEALTKVDTSRDIMVVHTFRFISMIAILMGHRFISEGPAPTYNPSYHEDMVRNPMVIYLVIGPVLVVDTFFFLSGFLTANQILRDFDTGRFKLMSFYLHRYIRLTPVYMWMVGWFALFMQKTNSGPLWLARTSIEQERCLKNWWTNMFYLNNYVNTRDLCMFQSWHLTCDFHFLLFAPPLVYFLWKKPKYAISCILGLIACCAATLFTLTYLYDLDPIILSYKSVVADLGADPTFRLTYIPTHTRYIPYLIGILASYAYYKRKAIGIIPKRTIYIGGVVVFVLLHMPIATSLIYYKASSSYNAWSASLFAALRNIPWTTGIAIMVVVVATKNAYYFQSLLEWKILAPLSRLTYSVYLTHSSVQLHTTGSLRTPEYNSNLHFAWYLFGDVLFIYIVAFFFYILYEAPILRLDRTYLTKQSRSPKKENEGEVNQGFSGEIPQVFSNTDGPFTISSTTHEKYSDHYKRKQSLEDR